MGGIDRARPELVGQVQVLSRAGHGVDLGAGEDGELDDHVSDAADAEDGQRRARARGCFGHGVVSGHAWTEQRSRLDVVEGVGNPIGVGGGGHHVLGITPVDGLAGDLLGTTELVTRAETVGTVPTGGPQGWTPTRSPRCSQSTSGPTAATRPTTSCPGMMGVKAGTP